MSGLEKSRPMKGVVIYPLDYDWTALTEGVSAITTWAGTSESFKSVRGVVLVKVTPVSGSGYSGVIQIYSEGIPVAAGTFSFDDEGIVTEQIGVPNNMTLKVIMAGWTGTGSVNIHIMDT